MIGARLAHYEITNHLGSGGMGEVYQATDSKLRRNVALKFLPKAFARDADRVTRFEREARMLASLNDPHIAAIYGLEEFEDRRFLVMELAPGETLAHRIARGPIPVKDALAIGVQIAAALEAAHDKGVVHRDLKPANIKVTTDGQVKVLDFGLAKAFAVERMETNLADSPTLSSATASGIILGTLAYMSPEQAKGFEVDRRTDIFAFGAVLFEMLTGRQAFRGDTTAETLARVIEREPDWKSLPPGLDPRTQNLLRHCLEKDPKKRRRDAADLRSEIEQMLSMPDQSTPPAPAIAKRTTVFAWIVAAILAGALALTLAMPRFRVPVEAPQMRLEISTPPTYSPASFTISPDGRHLVFIAAGDGRPTRLWLRPLDSTTARPLAGTEGASFPFWDPESRSIGFFADGRLKKIDISGGAPQTIADAGGGRGATWGPNNVILFSPNIGSPIFRVLSSGGEAAAVTKVAPGGDDRFPKFLPGGRQFLFYRTGDSAGMYWGSLDSMEVKRLTMSDSYGAYAAGWLFYVRQGVFTAQRFDLSRSELTGTPVVVADSILPSAAGAGAFSVSASGLIAYRSPSINTRQLVWYDRLGRMLATWGDPDTDAPTGPEISPDGRQVLITRTNQGNQDIWMLDANGRRTRLTLDAGQDVLAVWSPDRTQIVFGSTRRGGFDLFKKPAVGTGGDELLFDSGGGEIPDNWSRDGRFLLYYVQPPKSRPDVWALPMVGEKKTFPIANTPADERMSEFSPDGRWVAYQSDEAGSKFEIYVKPFPPRPGQWTVSKGGGSQVRWSRDGKELYYISPDGKMMAVRITVNGESIEAGTPIALFPTRIWGGGGANTTNRQQYDVSADGRFLIDTSIDENLSPITVVLNWKPPK